MIDSVVPNRELERTMAYHGSSNDVGRIGAEIAYSVAKEKLGLKDVLMNEPARPGTDLFTKEGNVEMDAKMLQKTALVTSKQVVDHVGIKIVALIGDLGREIDN